MKSYSGSENNGIRLSEPTDEVGVNSPSEAVAFGEPTARIIPHAQIVATYTRKKGLEIQRVIFK